MVLANNSVVEPIGQDGRPIELSPFQNRGTNGACGTISGNSLYTSSHNNNPNGGMIIPVQSDPIQEISICFDTNGESGTQKVVLFDALQYHRQVKGITNSATLQPFLAKFPNDPFRVQLFMNSLSYTHHKIWKMIFKSDNVDQLAQAITSYYYNVDTTQAKEKPFSIHMARREDNQNGDIYLELPVEMMVTARFALELNLLANTKTQVTFLIEGSVNDY